MVLQAVLVEVCVVVSEWLESGLGWEVAFRQLAREENRSEGVEG